MHTTRRGTQARQIREAPYWRMGYLALTLVFLIGIPNKAIRQCQSIFPRCPISISLTSTNWQTKTNLGSNQLPILISLQMDHTINPIPHRTSFNLKKANWDRYRRDILRTIILKAASRHIPSGRHHINTEPVPAEILEKMRGRDDLRSHLTRPATDEHRDHQNYK